MWLIPVLIVFGIVLMLIELLLTPGVGIAGILALASLIWSCVLAFNQSILSGIIVTAIVVLLVVGSLVFVLRSKTWRKLQLKDEIDTRVNEECKSVKVGMTCVTLTRIAPMGTVKFDGFTCEAKSHDNHMIDPGTPAEVVEIVDNKLIIKPITQ